MMLPQRTRWRVWCRDLAALAAFGAVALSGSVPIPVMALFGLGWLLSVAGRRPFADRPVMNGVLLLLLAAGIFGIAWRGLIDVVVAAVSFTLLLTTQRLLAETSKTTEQQVLLASLLLVAGGAALSGELWYGGALLVFGLFACLTLGLSVLEGPDTNELDLPVRPVVLQVVAGVGISLLGGVLFFVTFPRLSWNVASRRTPPSVLGGTTGMSDRVRLGGGGSIKTNARVVLRARIDPDPGVAELNQYWVGRFFDVFDGREWKGSGVDEAPANRVRLAGVGRRSYLQRIELLPAYDARTLVALDAPIIFENALALTTSGQVQVPLIESLGEEVRFATSANGYVYTAHSRAPEGDSPEGTDVHERYSALPALDPRVAAFATELAGTETEPLKVARKLESALRNTFDYTLELPGEVPDPLADFLFVRRAGHCEHFATALAVLLRTRGVATRVVTGFFGGARINDGYVVRAGDAHAWVQAFIPGTGWVGFDATPPRGRQAQSNAMLAYLTTVFEQVEQWWRNRVVDYSLQDQVQLVRALVRPPQDAERSAPVSLNQLPRGRVVAGLGAAALAFVIIRFMPTRRRRHRATTFLDELEAALRTARVERGSGEELEELTRRLVVEHHPLAAPLRLATRAYLDARFADAPLNRDDRRRLLAPIVAHAQAR